MIFKHSCLRFTMICWYDLLTIADPTATPPAVAAIWPNRLGCCGAAATGAGGCAWVGTGWDARGVGDALRGAALQKYIYILINFDFYRGHFRKEWIWTIGH